MFDFTLAYYSSILALISSPKCIDYPEILPPPSLITPERSYELSSLYILTLCKCRNPHTHTHTHASTSGSCTQQFLILTRCSKLLLSCRTLTGSTSYPLTPSYYNPAENTKQTADTQNIQWPTERQSIKFTYMSAQTKKKKKP